MAKIVIDRLALSAQGLSEAEAQSLAVQLADRLAENPVLGSSRQIDKLQVTITLSGNKGTRQIAEQVGDELLRQIAREGS